MSAPAPTEWMTAAEIADLRLPELPHTKSAVIRRAVREGWQQSGYARRRNASGGGWEYNVSVLPEAAASEVARRIVLASEEGRSTAMVAAAGRELAEAKPVASALTPAQRAVMEARAALLAEIDRLIVTRQRKGARLFTRSLAIDQLLDVLAHGRDDDPVAIAFRAAVSTASERKSVSRTHLFGWLKARDRFGLIGLAPKVKHEKDPLPAWFDDWLRFYAKPTKPCLSEALNEYTKTLPDPAAAPNYDQVRRALKKLGPLERVQGREGKLAMRKRLAYVSRDTSDLLPGSVYVGDGKTFDAEIAHPIHGQPFRPEITSWIDAATRVCVGWSVDLDENTFGVVDALRMSCARWCIPALVYTDRGPGYVNNLMTDTMIGFLGRAGITPMKALPYNSQAKGIVERLNQIYTPFAKSFPTYIGADMDKEAKKTAFKVTRGEIKAFGTSRLLPSWTDFVAGLATTIEDYNDRPHSELPKITVQGRRRHMTPREAWAAKCAAGFEPIVPDAAELDDMFRPYMIRTTRRGLVELFTNRYFLLSLEALDGEEVAVGYEPADAGRVWVRRLDRTAEGRQPGALLGIAIFEGNKTRYVPVSAERAAMEKRAKGRLKRIDAKRDEIEAELSPGRFLELQPATSALPLDLATAIVAANDPLPIEARSAPAPRLGHDGRPRFDSDEAYAAWLLAHPDAVQPGDGDAIRDLLKSPATRDLFRLCGIDVEALKRLHRSIA